MPNIDSDCVLFDKITEHVCRIILNRPDVGNAQDFQLTYALNKRSALRELAAGLATMGQG
jgi:hypothetical protein